MSGGASTVERFPLTRRVIMGGEREGNAGPRPVTGLVRGRTARKVGGKAGSRQPEKRKVNTTLTSTDLRLQGT